MEVAPVAEALHDPRRLSDRGVGEGKAERAWSGLLKRRVCILVPLEAAEALEARTVPIGEWRIFRRRDKCHSQVHAEHALRSSLRHLRENDCPKIATVSQKSLVVKLSHQFHHQIRSASGISAPGGNRRRESVSGQ